MQTSPSLSKVWFVVSIALLTFLYGTAVGKWEWFPHSFLNQAMDQARVLQGQVMERDSTDGIIMYDRVYGRVGTRVLEPEKMKPGLVLVSSQWEDDDGWDSELRIIDRKGKVLHRWEIDREKVFQGGISQRRQPTETSVHGSHLSENGDVFVNLSYVGMIKINSCGDVVWELGEGNHHGMTQADDGSFWTPAVSDNRRTSTPAYPNGFPGLDEPIWMDQLLHISENGDVIDRINLLDVLKKNGLADHIVKGSKYNYKDPLHINDVNYLSKSISNEYPLFGEGDMLLSLRNPNLLLVLEPKKNEVKWSESRYFTYQHDPDFIGDGWIGVFDNRHDGTERGELLGESRIVKVQPHTDSMKVAYPTSNSESIYSTVRGRFQQLDNGNMLIAEYTGGRAIEVSPSGSTLWEFIPEPLNDSKGPGVTKANHVDLTREEIASWPCSSIDSISTSAQKQSTTP